MPARLTLAALTVAALLLGGSASAHAFTAKGSIGQAYVLDARKGERLTLLGPSGRAVASGVADRLGSRIFRAVRPGTGYRVRRANGTRSPAFRVLSQRDRPPRSLYTGQRLKQGLNYVKVRDGLSLAMTVRLPAGKTLADGPFPTLIEHSGYQVAAPKDLLSTLAASLGGTPARPDPLVPATSTVVGAVIGPLLGYAVVSVQMRGSGCSAGAFDLFDLPTTYDGYDAVETVAAQPWVKGRKVGMVGISFSGISQLFAAGTRPPSLAAIAPMSVTDDVYQGTGFPGGIFNNGFAMSWVTERMENARPAPADGAQPYANALVRSGDRDCRRNQKLRLQTEDALAVQRRNPYRTPSVYAQRAPGAWIPKIEVPVFFVSQFNDEQTGGHFAQSLGGLQGKKDVFLNLQGGVHCDALGPQVLTRWVEFLDLFVADRVPRIPDQVLGLGGALYQVLASAGASPLEQSRFAGMTDVAAAKAMYRRDPHTRLLMDNGAGPAGPGSIGTTWEMRYGSWPIREAQDRTFFLGERGELADARPAQPSTAAYTGDPRARPLQSLPGTGEADAWKAQPPYTWRPLARGKGLGWTSSPLTSDLVMAGASSLDLQLRSSARDTDLQVTLSEVRPDGQETYLQNGWLRASHRKLDARRSTASNPVPTHLPQDAAPLPRGRTTLVRVPIYPFAYAFRAGSRIRVTVAAPGGDRPRWRFDTIERGRTRNTVSLGGATPSRLVLPVLPGATAQGTPLPAPTALRGQPSRTYVAAGNGG